MTLVSLSTICALRLAEGHLVGNLEEVAERLGAFAVEAAHGQADLVHGLDDLGDLVVEHERGQVHHGRGAHAGADVGRAGGEVADLGREGEVEFLLQLRVELVDGLEQRLELQAGAQRLDAEVVLLVDHDAERAVLADDEAAAGVLGGVLAADEVLLDEDLLFERREVLHRVVDDGVLHLGQLGHGGLDEGEHLLALGLLGPAGKGVMIEVAGEAQAAAEHDAVAAVLASNPFARGLEQILNFHCPTRIRFVAANASGVPKEGRNFDGNYDGMVIASWQIKGDLPIGDLALVPTHCKSNLNLPHRIAADDGEEMR